MKDQECEITHTLNLWDAVYSSACESWKPCEPFERGCGCLKSSEDAFDHFFGVMSCMLIPTLKFLTSCLCRSAICATGVVVTPCTLVCDCAFWACRKSGEQSYQQIINEPPETQCMNQ